MAVSVAESSEFATGWRVLVAATVGAGLSAVSLLTTSFGTFIIPLSREFGWSRGQISIALLFMTGTYALISPILGAALDRYGSRRLALMSIAPLAAALAGLAFVQGSLFSFYGCFILATIVGCGTAPVSYSRAITQTFTRRRGLALGIMLSGMGFAAALFPILTTAVTGAFGWRAAYGVLALLAFAALPVIYLGLKGPGVSRASATPRRSGRPDYGFLRQRTFWTITAACSLASFASYGLLVNLVPLYIDSGLSVATAARYAALVGLSSATARLVVGFLMDRVFAPYIGAAVLAASAVGCAAFLYLGLPAAATMAALTGFSFGMEVDLVSFLVARYFGVQRYGLIYGLLYSCFSASAALGPTVGGFVFDITGTYRVALIGSAVTMLASSSIMLLLPSYPADVKRTETY
jgi:MFS family permease